MSGNARLVAAGIAVGLFGFLAASVGAQESPAAALRYAKSCFFTTAGQKKWCEYRASPDGAAYYWEGWCNGKIYRGTARKQRSYVFAMGDGGIDGGGGVAAKPAGPGHFAIYSWGFRRRIGDVVRAKPGHWTIFKQGQKKAAGYATGPYPIVVAVDWFNGQSCHYDH